MRTWGFDWTSTDAETRELQDEIAALSERMIAYSQRCVLMEWQQERLFDALSATHDVFAEIARGNFEYVDAEQTKEAAPGADERRP